jgi:hypothetical protein
VSAFIAVFYCILLCKGKDKTAFPHTLQRDILIFLTFVVGPYNFFYQSVPDYIIGIEMNDADALNFLQDFQRPKEAALLFPGQIYLG